MSDLIARLEEAKSDYPLLVLTEAIAALRQKEAEIAELRDDAAGHALTIRDYVFDKRSA